ncbi:gluconokinase [Mesorhizobium sp.]|uniref:gluconokinase n=1 Tax=Mesorhizobium sp. TaxID=1871066 RepID=UPI000FEA12C0|nr:gluconokinase [Mesorhizobium sp.]RWK38333.1 MAG: gluconokinase [Mesorhizobium sp.]RWK67056.1 MAG: gluconokinase [Mesorhizobium sp.]RWK74581.1 MAG: gluconokinase [Mesorhizobium sp.]RWK83883.1 MAG: gluconokinase [Mesorhizobium sp.]RWL00493.1 MAG: gluconokinase [Mesorhizobium sp.]
MQRKRIRPAPAVVVMGVAGCGKSAVGEALAAALGAVFVEGDRLHPPENVARMASGEPLTDALREGWLDAIGRRIAGSVGDGQAVVAACSALKRSYRERLRGFCQDILFLYLEIDPATAKQRVGSRQGHFMPASLVDSQFATLEPPAADENALTLEATRPIADIVGDVVMLFEPNS